MEGREEEEKKRKRKKWKAVKTGFEQFFFPFALLHLASYFSFSHLFSLFFRARESQLTLTFFLS
jgi:hypothetical protein